VGLPAAMVLPMCRNRDGRAYLPQHAARVEHICNPKPPRLQSGHDPRADLEVLLLLQRLDVRPPGIEIFNPHVITKLLADWRT
jgi:hypothetical protein